MCVCVLVLIFLYVHLGSHMLIHISHVGALCTVITDLYLHRDQ